MATELIPSMTKAFPHIAVIGGGPAGAATALALRNHAPNFTVTLVEAGAYECPRIGETLHPAARSLLLRLGAWDGFVAGRHSAAYGSVSVWGSDEPVGNDFFTSRFGSGFHLDRRRFDAQLAELAGQRGVRLLHHTRLTRAGQTPDAWQLELAGQGVTHQLEADFVVDATGRRAVFARQAGAKRMWSDRLIGAFLFFDIGQNGNLDTRAWIEAVPYGWWYVARLPDGRAAAACMSDHDIVRHLGLVGRGGWLEAWAKTRHLCRWLRDATPDGKPVLSPAQAGCLAPCTGKRWLAVGDAAAQFDPLSGQGLAQALRGGIAAAYAIADDLAGRQGALARYAHLVDSEVRAFAQARAHYYGLERRWPNEVFWRRRQA